MFGKSKKNKSLSAWKAREALIPNGTRSDWISYNCRRLHIAHIYAKVGSNTIVAEDAEDMIFSLYQKIRDHELIELRAARAAGRKITVRDRIALMSARWYLAWARERIEDAKKVVDTK